MYQVFKSAYDIIFNFGWAPDIWIIVELNPKLTYYISQQFVAYAFKCQKLNKRTKKTFEKNFEMNYDQLSMQQIYRCPLLRLMYSCMKVSFFSKMQLKIVMFQFFYNGYVNFIFLNVCVRLENL